jgi:hypothetical protein
MAEDAVSRSSRRVIALRLDQLATTQKLERGLDCAFRKAGLFRERAQAGGDRFPFRPHGLSEEMEIDEIRRRLAIVPDNVAHQDVEDVIVDGNRFAESRHTESKKEELRIRK